MTGIVDWSPTTDDRPMRESRPGSTDLQMASIDEPLIRIADGVYMSKGTTNSYLVTTPEGDVRFSVTAIPGGETLDSLIVHPPDRGILFTGNALGPLFPHMPNLHTIRGDRPRPALPYIATYDRILALEPDLLVTGHFEPVAGRAFIHEQLTRLRDAVR